MCYRKRLYRNPVKWYNKTGFDKAVIHTPCCKCPACRKKRSSDWLVRSYYEFKYALPDRQAFFVSLDFDNQHLPIYELGYGLLPYEQRMFIHDFAHLPGNLQACFDSEEIKSFLARLRYYIGPFRYFISTDYGGALKRPHYHMAAFPKNLISEDDFVYAIEKCWTNGSHQDIELLPSVDHNKLQALKYISQYTTKDVSFDLDKLESNLPMRFRSRIHVSANFGLCAIEDCTIPDFISKDMIRDRKLLALPLGKNGTLLKFQIPRYYELKYTYDYHWDKVNSQASLIKNEFGVELAKLKHNGEYVYKIKQFFASRHDLIPDRLDFLSLTPYSGWKWHDIVMDVMSDFEDFCQFVYYRDFIYRVPGVPYYINSFSWSDTVLDDLSPGYILTSVLPDPVYYPKWDIYNKVFLVFDTFLQDLNSVKDKIETDKLVRAAKKREYVKIRRNRQKYNYLQRIGFDINSLLT